MDLTIAEFGFSWLFVYLLSYRVCLVGAQNRRGKILAALQCSLLGLLLKFWLPMHVHPTSLKVSFQIIGQMRLQDSLAKKFASQFLPTLVGLVWA